MNPDDSARKVQNYGWKRFFPFPDVDARRLGRKQRRSSTRFIIVGAIRLQIYNFSIAVYEFLCDFFDMFHLFCFGSR